jgi:glutathione-specific gamma-glutamylcyclotransferase
MITGVYDPRWRNSETPRGPVRAVAYVADRKHPQYVGKLSERCILEMILGGVGVSGSNRDYLAQTVRHLDELGIADGPLHRLQRLVKARK